MYDAFIEIYVLKKSRYPRRLLYREIPEGTTMYPFDRPPDYIIKVRFKPGFTLGVDHPTGWYILEYPKPTV